MARILIVDDDVTICTFVERVLKRAKHHVVSAHDAVSGYDKLQTHRFDLLISDANLPKFSGYHLIHKVRETQSELPIVMLTGRKEKKDIEKAIEIGVNDYIVKPFEPKLLIEKISSVLSGKPALVGRPQQDELTAQIVASATVLDFDENGMNLLVPWPVREKESVAIQSPLFAKIGIETPQQRVAKIEKFETGKGYYIRTEFVSLPETAQLKIEIFRLKKDLKAMA